MDIGPFISELLEEQNEVTVPGIGTFFKKRRSAFFDEAKGLFFPPSLIIDFSPEELGSSVELSSYVSKQKNLSPPSARYFTEKYAETIRKELLAEGEAEIETLGTLKKQEFHYSFSSKKLVQDKDLFGLLPVREIKNGTNAPKPIIEDPSAKEAVIEKPVVVDVPVISPPAKEEEPEEKWRSKYESVVIDNTSQPEPAPAIIQSTEAEEIEETEPRRRKIWPIVLVMGLLIILGSAAAVYYYYPQLFNVKKSTQSSKPATKPRPEPVAPLVSDSSVAVADSIYNQLKTAGQEAGLEVEKAPDTVSITANSIAVKDTVPKEKTTNYDIISASFNRKSEAENYIREMRKKGIDAQVVEDVKRPKFKVSIGRFTNKEKAEAEKRRIHEGLTKEAWILKTNN